MKPFRVDCVVGTRPNFVKIAPILAALRKREGVTARLIHTGQHYDAAMDGAFFEELRIPHADINLAIGSASSAAQTARMMLSLEPLFASPRPDLLIVVGDVNSTLAAALTAAKMAIPVAHVEAGLRSFDRAMPEEINRILVDRLADLHFVTEPQGVENLRAEATVGDGVKLVGNVMIDSLLSCLDRGIPAAQVLAEAQASSRFAEAARRDGFAFATLHRPSNVDDPRKLEGHLRAFADVSRDLPLVFAIHPRTRAAIVRHGLEPWLETPMLQATGPLSYLRTIGMMREAQVVITDSGGIQEETTALGVPCLTLRDNTERPITVEQGTNTLIGSDPALLADAVDAVLDGGGKRGRVPPLWDGKAAERIADGVMGFM